MLRCVYAVLISAACGFCVGEDPLFPFIVSFDSPDNATNVSKWLDRPAGKNGFVRENRQGTPMGHLVNDAGPIRFWATNICFDGCFPSREQAEQVAARLARLGINCVRLHHMDTRSIWGKSPNKLTIDPAQLDRLDYFIAQLKQNGVYVNINLHVSRTLGKKEGFENEEGRPKYDKGLDNFEPRMIELQKKYARDLLTHVNPYTKTAYANEPAVAFVEINNENAMFDSWSNSQLDELAEPYATTYRHLWNDWLKKKYGGTAALIQAWHVERRPLGPEMLTNGDWSAPLGLPWRWEVDGKNGAKVSIESAGPDGGKCLRIKTLQPPKQWRPQVHHGGLAVKKDTPYTLVCRLRADSERSVSVNCMMAHDPWQRLGLSEQVKVGPKWRDYQFAFTAERDDDNARVGFSGLGEGTFEVGRISLRSGGGGLEPNQTLESKTIPVVRRRGSHVSATARRDFVDFIWETERGYWTGMHDFLKKDLKVRSLVAGTQLGWSPVHVQAALDYLDGHSYWQHPHFPGKPWDSNNWTVRNIALVNNPPGTLGGLAAKRVLGRAYCVSEYNHPQPNQYCGEGLPMIAAYGSWQGWDGIYSFAYSHNDKFESRKLESYFDIKSDPCRMVHSAACAAMFLRGDVAQGKNPIGIWLSEELERKQLVADQTARNLSADKLGLEPGSQVTRPVGLMLERKADNAASAEKTDNRQIDWDVSKKDAGFFTVDSPRTKLFTGFVAGRKFSLGNVELAIGKTRLDWATVSMVCVDGKGFDQPGRILIAATGLVQNTGAELQKVSDDKVTLGRNWGSEPIVCEGIPAEISLPVAANRLKIYPLDESGNRRTAISAKANGKKAVIRLEPGLKTLWYEVEIK